MVDLFYLVVEQIQVNNTLNLMFTANPLYQVLAYKIKLAAHWDFRWHRIFDGYCACVLVEFVAIFHELANMRIYHKIMQRPFKTTHITSVQILCCQVYTLRFVSIFSEPDLCISQNSLSFANATEQRVTLFINNTCFSQTSILCY